MIKLLHSIVRFLSIRYFLRGDDVISKVDLGIEVHNDFIVAYTKKKGTYRAHISKGNQYLARLEHPNFLALQKEVPPKLKELRKQK